MSRSPCHWTLSCLPSSLLSSSFNFIFFYFGLTSPYTIHTLIQSLKIISPLPPGGLKNFFKNILGRQVAGESSDLLGCVCVCCVCVCVGGPFSLPLSLFTLYPFIVTTSSVTLFSFPAGAALLKKVSYHSIHPSLILSLVFQLLQMTFFFSLYVLHLWTDWTLGDFSDCLTSIFLIFFLIIILYPFYVFLSSKTFLTNYSLSKVNFSFFKNIFNYKTFLTIVCQKSIFLSSKTFLTIVCQKSIILTLV